ncbi:MAG TPA: SRPBCC family protein [Pseudonocardiaceae bacterium]|jgi:hypothetical protein|nr:SRPBCC family protein [Pseudonocardiaceae bacterium]
MRRQYIDVRVPTEASPDVLYQLLRDGSTWPTWSPLDSFELREPAIDEPEGIGAIRVFRTGRVTSVERVVELVPDRRLSYELVSGLPLRGYHGDVDIESDDSEGQTTIHWHSSFEPKVPGTGWLYRRALSRFIARCARGLAMYAVTTKISER